ncbi:MAG: hypothetical protein M1135_02565 [Candidatus Omnitrophica bacterium]|nr:hypothetical protein [Candidatus Omnitrophota bacterium]
MQFQKSLLMYICIILSIGAVVTFPSTGRAKNKYLLNDKFSSKSISHKIWIFSKKGLTENNGRLLFYPVAENSSWNIPSIWSKMSFSRNDIGALGASVCFYVSSNPYGPIVGFAANSSTSNPLTNAHGIFYSYPFFYVTGILSNFDMGIPGQRVHSMNYLMVTIPRPGGGYLYAVSGGDYGTFPKATLLWESNTGNEKKLYATVTSKNQVCSLNFVRLLKASQMPAVYRKRYGLVIAGDTFNRKNGPAGNTEFGKFKWSGKGAIIKNNKLSPGNGQTAMLTDVAKPPYIIEVSVLTPNKKSPRSVTLSFRQAQDGKAISFLANNSYVQLLDSYTNKVLDQTGAWTLPLGKSQLRIVDWGNHITCFINNQPVLQGTTTDGVKGTGISLVNNTGSKFTDFSIWPQKIMLPSALGPMSPIVVGGNKIAGDNFSGKNGTSLSKYNHKWITTGGGGGWEIENGHAEPTTGWFAVQDVGTPNQESSADITFPKTAPPNLSSGDWFCGVVCRYTNQNSYIFSRFIWQMGSIEIETWEFRPGKPTPQLNAVNLGYKAILPGSTHRISMDVYGKYVSVYFDGKLVSQSITKLLTGDKCGIAREKSNVWGVSSWSHWVARKTYLKINK